MDSIEVLIERLSNVARVMEEHSASDTMAHNDFRGRISNIETNAAVAATQRDRDRDNIEALRVSVYGKDEASGLAGDVKSLKMKATVLTWMGGLVGAAYIAQVAPNLFKLLQHGP